VIRSNIVVTISSTSSCRRCGLLAASSAMRSDLVNVGSVLTIKTTRSPLSGRKLRQPHLVQGPSDA